MKGDFVVNNRDVVIIEAGFIGRFVARRFDARVEEYLVRGFRVVGVQVVCRLRLILTAVLTNRSVLNAALEAD